MIIYAVTVGNHDTVYLKYFVLENLAKNFKEECENAPSREDYEKLPEIVKAKKEWENYKNEINEKYPKRLMHELPQDIKQKWSDLISAWYYNPNWGHFRYDIEEIQVIE